MKGLDIYFPINGAVQPLIQLTAAMRPWVFVNLLDDDGERRSAGGPISDDPGLAEEIDELASETPL